MNRIPAIFSWSGGKDSAYALYKVQQQGRYEVKYLLSTFNGHYKRLSMHGVREELIQAQADNLGIPLLKAYVYEASNVEYEQQMAQILLKARTENIFHVMFGDIFLEDLRQYRQSKMAAIGMFCEFPLWKQDTGAILEDFIAKGFKTITCCINDSYLDRSWAGRIIDRSFIAELPASVDRCGENGEFHSFCFESPLYKSNLHIKTGRLTYRPLQVNLSDHPGHVPDIGTKGFWFCDLLLHSSASNAGDL